MMENFIITIGRQAGSGGREIGMRLAQRLGIPYYGRQELMEIAKGTPDYEEVQSFYEEQPVEHECCNRYGSYRRCDYDFPSL